ncbi:MAG TPA: PQQ-binding-like beta-propeller repeat protein [Gammaproteobacteria bacterium]
MTAKVASLALGCLWSTVAMLPAVAEDIELFVGTTNFSNSARPNVLLILDDSISMDATLITQNNYDPTKTYSGPCSKDYVYWASGSSTTPPSCGSSNRFRLSDLKCKAALDAFAAPGGGLYRDMLASYDSGTQKRWESLASGRPVECKADWGIHGETTGSSAVYPRNGNTSALWTSGTTNRITWGQNPTNTHYWIYHGNWLNWYYSPGTTATRLQVVKDVANSLVASIDGINVGLMHFSQTSSSGPHGGRVAYAMEDVTTARSGMQSAINALTASKWTPLSETLYEAALYMLGRPVDHGLANPKSVPESHSGGTAPVYNSPIDYSCQKNYIVLLTDGAPTGDDDSDSDILALTDAEGTDFRSLANIPSGGVCDAESYAGIDLSPEPEGGDCLDDLAEFMFKGDMSPLPGKQNVVTHVVGFALEDRNGQVVRLPVLLDTAQRGGGKYYEAVDSASLFTTLTGIVTEILQTQSTFTSPAVSVNSFNRTQNLNDLYITLFEPSGTEHWPGNLKKFRLRPSDAAIVDATGKPAVDPATGFFIADSQSLWADTPDGQDIKDAGAAHRIPAARKVYTHLVGTDLTADENRVSLDNMDLDDGLLNTGDPDQPTREQVINFINGLDASDIDNDGDVTERRNQMGDPLHSQPASVVYGPTVDDAIIFVATNDGFLHAINAQDGVERWAFLPPEFLKQQVNLFLDQTTPIKTYGIDGNVRVQVLGNNDGVIDPDAGERVLLFFGMRRGEHVYYGLDVTNPDAPQFLWRHDESTLPGLGQTWSSPAPTRIEVDGSGQNEHHLVVVLGGGYEPDQDNSAASTDTVGNSIYIVDSINGTLLWHGSKDGRDADFDQSGKSMDYSIPADVKVVDFDGDGYADRMYAADMGGQIWRFDVYNGQSAANLVTGGVIAQLGAAPAASPALADVRRFYYSPDVALVSTSDVRFIHIGIGSGHRPHPLSKENADRFYALRDFNALRKLTQTEYNAITPITEDDLDIITGVNTTVANNSAGWMLQLDAAAGEKVLAEARTFNNQVFFTTFTPSAGPGADPCAPTLGTSRLYVVSLFDAAPVTNLDGSVDDSNLTETDRYVEFGGSIAAEVVFLFPSPEDPQNCTGSECTPPPVACVDLFCMPTGFANNPVRTFWRQESVDSFD